MKVVFHRTFDKQYKKLPVNVRKRTRERIHLFLRDEFDPVLNNHPLHGKYKGYRSINIAGDLRAIYKTQNKDVRVFVAVGTHDTLYA